MIRVVGGLPEHVMTLPALELPAVFLLVSPQVVLSQEIFLTFLALEVARFLVDQFHVSLDVILPGEPVATQLAPELFEAQVSPEVRPVGLLLQSLVTLRTLDQHHVSLAQQFGNTEGLAQERIDVSRVLVASENYKRFLRRFIAAAVTTTAAAAAAGCFTEVRHTFSKV